MAAKSNVPWSVKGIDPDARSVAKELARREGKTLGEWMTAMIREKGLNEAGLAEDETDHRDDSSGAKVSGVTTDQLRDVIGSLNRLTERISLAEKNLQITDLQSRQAMGGLNKGLETVFERIKRLEREPGSATDGIDAEDIADIAERLDRLEGGGKKSWVDSLKALERALSTLVEQVEASRQETDVRLARNEDVLEALRERIDADDEALRGEIGDLLDAIDRTTDRVSATEERVSEALGVAREAAQSHDETFIERTSNNLRLLGSEIKRTSDQIRTLETSVDKLQDKIEAGEQRSAEGISRVAQSLENLRQQIETKTLQSGDESTSNVRTSLSEAERRLGAVQGAFSAVVDRLEGHVSTGQTGKPSTTTSAPWPFGTETSSSVSPTGRQDRGGYTEGKRGPSEPGDGDNGPKGPTASAAGAVSAFSPADTDGATDDPFDRPFVDPLGLTPAQTDGALVQQQTHGPRESSPSLNNGAARTTPNGAVSQADYSAHASASPQLAPPFGGLVGPGAIAAGNTALAMDTDPDAEPMANDEQNRGWGAAVPGSEQARRPDFSSQTLPEEPQEHRPAASEPAQEFTGFGGPSASESLDAPLRWDRISSPDEPINTVGYESGYANDSRLADGELPPITDRLAHWSRQMFSRDVDNNPALGWVLLIGAAAAVILASWQLAKPGNMEPVVVEASAPATKAAPPVVEKPVPPTQEQQPRTAAVEKPEPAAMLYASAKERLASAATAPERNRAVADLTRAAEQGSLLAQHDLGEMYLNGTVVTMDGYEARLWFTTAADEGHLPSINRLATLDIKGIGGPADEDAAIEGFSRAAQAGFTKAMINLATMYNPDNAWLPDSDRSASESYYWYRLAELSGDRSALDEATRVASRLPADVRQTVEDRAEAFRPVSLSR